MRNVFETELRMSCLQQCGGPEWGVSFCPLWSHPVVGPHYSRACETWREPRLRSHTCGSYSGHHLYPSLGSRTRNGEQMADPCCKYSAHSSKRYFPLGNRISEQSCYLCSHLLYCSVRGKAVVRREMAWWQEHANPSADVCSTHPGCMPQCAGDIPRHLETQQAHLWWACPVISHLGRNSIPWQKEIKTRFIWEYSKLNNIVMLHRLSLFQLKVESDPGVLMQTFGNPRAGWKITSIANSVSKLYSRTLELVGRQWRGRWLTSTNSDPGRYLRGRISVRLRSVNSFSLLVFSGVHGDRIVVWSQQRKSPRTAWRAYPQALAWSHVYFSEVYR